MYEHNERQMIMPDEFFLPFGGRLDPNNRWAVMANLIPWSKLEDEYIQLLNDSTRGNKAYSVRTAIGALIIKERLGLSDRETIKSIKSTIASSVSTSLMYVRLYVVKQMPMLNRVQNLRKHDQWLYHVG